MWNGTVRRLPLKEQLRAASIANCQALSVTPSDYNRWLGQGIASRDILAMALDVGVRITHLDPFVRWVDDWMPSIPGFPTDSIAYDYDDFFRMAAALKAESTTLKVPRHDPADEPPHVAGLDVVTVRGNRIVALYAFVDAPRPHLSESA
jgi:hypothetical protein